MYQLSNTWNSEIPCPALHAVLSMMNHFHNRFDLNGRTLIMAFVN